ncbi:MAG: SGNH/GDSL hydrolase family protein [Bacteroidetes bacterium]|jgi:hypothetical protein|uniref:hypothetical protein n=1 Tax=Daejeonella sp. TaxID=2805397 RepID=UPI00404AC6C2|nr:SGNH/GDSL hydrolase family protein [Bacteroidota bacterium]
MKKISIAFIISVLLTSCQVKEDIKVVPIQFKNILILGNSITKHAPIPQVGWHGNWGMAASVQSKDFSHIISTALKAQMTPVNISDFEMSHTVFDLKNLEKYFVQTPDLIIIKLGENVLQTTDFDKSFTKFISYIKEKAPNAKIVIAGTFWQNEPINKILIAESQLRKIPFVKLQQMDTQVNKSFIGEDMISMDGLKYKITDQGVANHPGDVGMKNIADLILAKVDSISKGG